MKILVLGAWRMGLGAAYDLAHNSADIEAVTIADIDAERARAVAATVKSAKLTPVQVDVTDAAQVVALMRGHDGAISCVTYFHNLQLARAAIEARTNFCDLGGNNAIVAAELALDAEAEAAALMDAAAPAVAEVDLDDQTSTMGDSVHTYLKSIGRTSLLTAEQEVNLAKQLVTETRRVSTDARREQLRIGQGDAGSVSRLPPTQ